MSSRDYSPPNGVFNFFICFSTSEWVTIASYLGYRQEELDPIVKGSPEDREQQVTNFLKLWQLPDCGRRCRPMMHKLKALAGIMEEKVSRKTLADTTNVTYRSKKLKMDIRGTPLKNLDPCPYYSLDSVPNLGSMDSELNDLSRHTDLETMGPESSYSIQEPNRSFPSHHSPTRSQGRHRHYHQDDLQFESPDSFPNRRSSSFHSSNSDSRAYVVSLGVQTHSGSRMGRESTSTPKLLLFCRPHYDTEEQVEEEDETDGRANILHRLPEITEVIDDDSTCGPALVPALTYPGHMPPSEQGGHISSNPISLPIAHQHTDLPHAGSAQPIPHGNSLFEEDHHREEIQENPDNSIPLDTNYLNQIDSSPKDLNQLDTPASNLPHLQDLKTGAVSQDDAQHREVYYKAIKEKIAVKIKMARLVHVGFPRSGKSSMIKRLMGDIMNLLELDSSSSPGAAGVITARSLCSDLVTISVNPEDPNSFQWLKLKGFVEEDSFLTHLLETVQKDVADAREREVSDIKTLPKDLDHLILLINTNTGGQPEFFDMISSLIMGPSLYLLYHRLLDKSFKLSFTDSDGESTLEEKNESVNVEETLFQVLASIASFSDPSIRDTCSDSSWGFTKSMHDKFPTHSRVLFVGTHLDELKSEKELLEKQKFLKERVKNMSLYKDGTLLFPERNKPILAVDNFKGLDNEIKNILAKIISHHFREITIPAAWLILSLYMRKDIKSISRRRIMFLEDCKEQAGKLGIDPTELKEALWFLHHCMGLIFYYPGVKGVEDKIFCDVQVIFDGITQLIMHTFSDPTRTGPGIIEKFKERGMFSDEDLRCAMQPCSDESNELPLDQLVKLLEHLKILMVMSSKSTGKKTYFMPCVLKSATAAELKTELNSIVTSKHNPAPLMLQYDCGYMPVGIFSHMVADLAFQWELTEEKIWKNMIKFSYKTNQVVLISHPSYIAIALSRGPRCSIPIEEICSTIRERIESSLETIGLHMDCKSNSMQYKFGFECVHDSSHPIKEHLALQRSSDDFLKCQVDQRILDLTESQRVWFLKVEVGAESNSVLSQGESETDFPTVASGPNTDPNTDLHTDPDAELNDLSEPEDNSSQPNSASEALGRVVKDNPLGIVTPSIVNADASCTVGTATTGSSLFGNEIFMDQSERASVCSSDDSFEQNDLSEDESEEEEEEERNEMEEQRESNILLARETHSMGNGSRGGRHDSVEGAEMRSDVDEPLNSFTDSQGGINHIADSQVNREERMDNGPRIGNNVDDGVIPARKEDDLNDLDESDDEEDAPVSAHQVGLEEKSSASSYYNASIDGNFDIREEAEVTDGCDDEVMNDLDDEDDAVIPDHQREDEGALKDVSNDEITALSNQDESENDLDEDDAVIPDHQREKEGALEDEERITHEVTAPSNQDESENDLDNDSEDDVMARDHQEEMLEKITHACNDEVIAPSNQDESENDFDDEGDSMAQDHQRDKEEKKTTNIYDDEVTAEGNQDESENDLDEEDDDTMAAPGHKRDEAGALEDKEIVSDNEVTAKGNQDESENDLDEDDDDDTMAAPDHRRKDNAGTLVGNEMVSGALGNEVTATRKQDEVENDFDTYEKVEVEGSISVDHFDRKDELRDEIATQSEALGEVMATRVPESLENDFETAEGIDAASNHNINTGGKEEGVVCVNESEKVSFGNKAPVMEKISFGNEVLVMRSHGDLEESDDSDDSFDPNDLSDDDNEVTSPGIMIDESKSKPRDIFLTDSEVTASTDVPNIPESSSTTEEVSGGKDKKKQEAKLTDGATGKDKKNQEAKPTDGATADKLEGTSSKVAQDVINDLSESDTDSEVPPSTDEIQPPPTASYGTPLLPKAHTRDSTTKGSKSRSHRDDSSVSGPESLLDYSVRSYADTMPILSSDDEGNGDLSANRIDVTKDRSDTTSKPKEENNVPSDEAVNPAGTQTGDQGTAKMLANFQHARPYAMPPPIRSHVPYAMPPPIRTHVLKDQDHMTHIHSDSATGEEVKEVPLIGGTDEATYPLLSERTSGVSQDPSSSADMILKEKKRKRAAMIQRQLEEIESENNLSATSDHNEDEAGDSEGEGGGEERMNEELDELDWSRRNTGGPSVLSYGTPLTYAREREMFKQPPHPDEGDRESGELRPNASSHLAHRKYPCPDEDDRESRELRPSASSHSAQLKHRSRRRYRNRSPLESDESSLMKGFVAEDEMELGLEESITGTSYVSSSSYKADGSSDAASLRIKKHQNKPRKKRLSGVMEGDSFSDSAEPLGDKTTMSALPGRLSHHERHVSGTSPSVTSSHSSREPSGLSSSTVRRTPPPHAAVGGAIAGGGVAGMGVERDHHRFQGTNELAALPVLDVDSIMEQFKRGDDEVGFLFPDGQEACSEEILGAIEDPQGLDMLKALVASGADVDAPTKEGSYALHRAISKGSAEKVLALLEKAVVNIHCKVSGQTPLHLACEVKNFHMIQMLVEKGADVNAIDGVGLTVLHYKSTLEVPDVAAYLLHKGTRVNAQHKNGATPLCLAVSHSSLASIKLLLKKGADTDSSWVHLSSGIRLTPISLAAACGREDVVSVLMDFRADVNAPDEESYPPIALAVMGGHLNLVEFFLKQNDLDCSLKGLWSAFCIGVQERKLECVALLLDKYRGGIDGLLQDSIDAEKVQLTEYVRRYKDHLANPAHPLPSKPHPQPHPQTHPQPLGDPSSVALPQTSNSPVQGYSDNKVSDNEVLIGSASDDGDSGDDSGGMNQLDEDDSTNGSSDGGAHAMYGRSLIGRKPGHRPLRRERDVRPSPPPRRGGGRGRGRSMLPDDSIPRAFTPVNPSSSLLLARGGGASASLPPARAYEPGALGSSLPPRATGAASYSRRDQDDDLFRPQPKSPPPPSPPDHTPMHLGISQMDSLGSSDAQLHEVVEVLHEFAQITLSSAIRSRDDGQEWLIEKATNSGHGHIERFFLNYFFNPDGFANGGKLVAEFIGGEGVPSPLNFLFMKNLVERHNFVKTLKEIGKPEFPDQLALALHQFPGSDHIPYDGHTLMDALFQQRIVIGSLGDGGQGGGVGGLMASSINPANFDPRQHSEGLGIQSLGGSGVSGYRDPRSSPPPPEPFSAPRSHTEPVFPESEGHRLGDEPWSASLPATVNHPPRLTSEYHQHNRSPSPPPQLLENRVDTNSQNSVVSTVSLDAPSQLQPTAHAQNGSQMPEKATSTSTSNLSNTRYPDHRTKPPKRASADQNFVMDSGIDSKTDVSSPTPSESALSSEASSHRSESKGTQVPAHQPLTYKSRLLDEHDKTLKSFKEQRSRVETETPPTATPTSKSLSKSKAGVPKPPKATSENQSSSASIPLQTGTSIPLQTGTSIPLQTGASIPLLTDTSILLQTAHSEIKLPPSTLSSSVEESSKAVTTAGTTTLSSGRHILTPNRVTGHSISSSSSSVSSLPPMTTSQVNLEARTSDNVSLSLPPSAAPLSLIPNSLGVLGDQPSPVQRHVSKGEIAVNDLDEDDDVSGQRNEDSYASSQQYGRSLNTRSYFIQRSDSLLFSSGTNSTAMIAPPATNNTAIAPPSQSLPQPKALPTTNEFPAQSFFTFSASTSISFSSPVPLHSTSPSVLLPSTGYYKPLHTLPPSVSPPSTYTLPPSVLPPSTWPSKHSHSVPLSSALPNTSLPYAMSSEPLHSIFPSNTIPPGPLHSPLPSGPNTLPSAPLSPFSTTEPVPFQGIVPSHTKTAITGSRTTRAYVHTQLTSTARPISHHTVDNQALQSHEGHPHLPLGTLSLHDVASVLGKQSPQEELASEDRTFREAKSSVEYHQERVSYHQTWKKLKEAKLTQGASRSSHDKELVKSDGNSPQAVSSVSSKPQTSSSSQSRLAKSRIPVRRSPPSVRKTGSALSSTKEGPLKHPVKSPLTSTAKSGVDVGRKRSPLLARRLKVQGPAEQEKIGTDTRVKKGSESPSKNKEKKGKTSKLPAASKLPGAHGSKDDFIDSVLRCVDSCPDVPLSKEGKLFQLIATNENCKRKWRMLGRYLDMSDKDIVEIKKRYLYNEERCHQMLIKWRNDNHFKATYLKIIYALFNIMQYDFLREVRSQIPSSSFDDKRHQSIHLVQLPLKHTSLSKLRDEFETERENKMTCALIRMHSDTNNKLSRPLVFRLVSLDDDGLKVVEYLCKAATHDGVQQINITVKYLKDS